MILELDCGNSLVKWRVVESVSLGAVARGVAASIEDLLAQLSGLPGVQILRSRLVSVRSDHETKQLVAALAAALGVDIQLATPARRLGGVANGYTDYQRLGMDRWLAMVGAFQLQARAALVIDLGTAVTVDLLDAQGVHLGGYICPGISLLRRQLHEHTQRIRYDATAAQVQSFDSGPGRSTAEAVERGCRLMLRSFVEAQIESARTYLGDDFAVYATGGDAALVADIPRIRCVPDLVFQGLAVACP